MDDFMNEECLNLHISSRRTLALTKLCHVKRVFFLKFYHLQANKRSKVILLRVLQFSKQLTEFSQNISLKVWCSKCPPPAETQVFTRLRRSAASHPISPAVHVLVPGWSSALD